jgi:rod shape-determining protein MreD
MKWLPFSILAMIALILQTTIAPAIAIHAIWPDCMFILTVHYALWASWPEAAIAGWCLGLLFDTQTLDPIGLHALCYGAAAWAIIQIRQVLFRDHVVTQFAITLLLAIFVQLTIWIFRSWHGYDGLTWTEIIWPTLFTAAYTAILAPYLHWPLLRMGKWTGLRTGKRSGSYR